MAGHSKWKQIKRKKAITDARRGASWTKVIREITVAAKAGGGDPGGNPRLRTAIDAAKAVNMPADNIDRAIKKGTGELEGAVYEEVMYEGYGPGGAAIIIEATTDNSTRTVAEVRHAFNRNGGNLGATNSVSWMFDRKGQIFLDATRYPEDATLEAALEAGAEDFARDGDQYVVSTTVPTFHAVQEALKARQLELESAEVAMVPKSTVKVEGKQAEQMIKLMEALEELDDVSKVFSNFDIDASQLAEASS
ncbi:MAG: YebC/PmpR family DNA-binding transcriptional regulator [Gemmatimonadetes bacterium]|nr:YebC/PmpR family DNA-binding transcriptional regulator [Gemmatimonadota bacterium]MBP6670476.1 YebC/PmpR family DNA-binding transcriptional regulator [Gemmatimonadales bacterium]MBK6781339.1 YebC/PmpR family DNA-binding transcriptional regulator [Gemmatimonadota bacterium]MBK7349766.1 YebC/PmpR family DNA-binding transcriptional regulator [Gemmatimonadota bacterium]MBK7716647.1 YebC/PmpR family DNA-binding transcriptional regulator [Gemmatimonadota bacterium]